jgi:hypothetical protein
MKYKALFLVLALILTLCAGCVSEKKPADDHTNQTSEDASVNAPVNIELEWFVDPTLTLDNVNPVRSYFGQEYPSVNGVRFTKNGLCGVMNYAGKVMIEPIYSEIYVYQGSYLCVQPNQGEQNVMQDSYDVFTYVRNATVNVGQKQSVLIKSIWSPSSLCVMHLTEGNMPMPANNQGAFFVERGEVYSDKGNPAIVRGTGKHALYCDGKIKTDFVYQDGFYASNGLIAAKQSGKWGYVDVSGKTVIPFEFDAVMKYYDKQIPYGVMNGFVPVCKGGKWGYYSATGQEVVPCCLENALPVNGAGLAFALFGGKWGVLKVAESAMGPAEGYLFPTVTAIGRGRFKCETKLFR